MTFPFCGRRRNAFGEWLGARVDPIDEPDHFLQQGQMIEFGAESLEVRFTPGHSPGHVVFVDHANEQIFAGDTLFRGSIGRFDLPLADGPTLYKSIRGPVAYTARHVRRLPWSRGSDHHWRRARGQSFCGQGFRVLLHMTFRRVQ